MLQFGVLWNIFKMLSGNCTYQRTSYPKITIKLLSFLFECSRPLIYLICYYFVLYFFISFIHSWGRDRGVTEVRPSAVVLYRCVLHNVVVSERTLGTHCLIIEYMI